MPVIPATEEVEVGGSWSKAILGKKSRRLYLKNKLKAKELSVIPNTKKTPKLKKLHLC
jgi:hypothetical protein